MLDIDAEPATPVDLAKAILGKYEITGGALKLDDEPVEILIVDEPSVGIDIKTKTHLYQLIRDLSDNGTALILITSDIPKMIALEDRIVVMHDYRLMGEITNTRIYKDMSERIEVTLPRLGGHLV